jgi:Lrp/AsnC family transcriptional regulator, leucine-responsive regulatory protein
MIDLDLIDRKMLSILDMKGRMPLTTLSKRLRISRDTANYRLQRLIREGIIKKFIAQIDTAKLGYSVYKLFYRFQNIDKEKKKDIFQWFMNNEFIYWVAESRGKWDANITIFAEDIHQFNTIMTEFVNKYGNYVAEQEFNTTVEVGALQKNWKIPSQNRDLRKLFSEKPEKNKLDEIDMKILRLISNNARLKTTEIAQILKTTERIIHYRLDYLEKNKLILGYSISVDYNKLGKHFFKSIVYLNTLSTSLKNKIIEYCKFNQSIIYYILCVGSWPLELEFAVDSNDEYYEEMDKFKELFPEIRGYETIIFPKEYKFEWIPTKP